MRETLGQSGGAAPRLGLLLGDVTLHLLELGRGDALGVGLVYPPAAAAPTVARGVDVGAGRGVGGNEAVIGFDALAAVTVHRLALLPVREHRRGDEDRRIRTGRNADEQREREILQRGAA